MLKLDFYSARTDFSVQIQNMHQLFEDTSKELVNHTFKMNRDKILLIKQIERLIIFLKEMDLHLSGFQKENSPDEKEVIFIFERQHLFKNIYRKHMSDYSSIME